MCRANVATFVFILPVLVSSACNSAKKAPECKVLVTSMGALHERLEEVRYVASSTEVKPTDVIEVMRPFSAAAKKIASDLKSAQPAVKEVREITRTAASAAASLSQGATEMADLAEKMTDVDADGKAVDEHKQQVDKLELQIKEICEATPSKCANFSEILARFPAPTDQAEVTDDAQAWTRKLNAWANELAKVDVQDSALKEHVTNFVKNWQELAISMGHMVSALEVSKKYEALTKNFNEQIAIANKAIAEANSQCATK